MNLVEEVGDAVLSWCASYGHVTAADVDVFNGVISSVELKLKDKLALNKRAAKFLKLCISSNIEERTLYTIQNRGAHEDRFFIESSNNLKLDAIDDFGTGITFEKQWNYELDSTSHLEENLSATKEVLKVSREVREFMKSCLSRNYDTPMLCRIKQQTTSDRFFLNNIDLTREEDWSSGFLFVPPEINIKQLNEQEYIEEEIGEVSGCSISSPEQMSVIDNSEKKFSIDLITILEIVSESLQMNVSHKTWSAMSTDSEVDWNFEESRLLSEDLENGVEFRLSPLFMDTRPTFDEPSCPFDFVEVCAHVPKYDTHPITDYDTWCSACPFIETDFTDEQIAHNPHTLLTLDIRLPQMILSDELILDGDGFRNEDHLRRETYSNWSVKNHEEVEDILIKNSNIGITNSILEEESHTTVSANAISESTGATKMSSSRLDITENSAVKRDWNDELDDLIIKKKKTLGGLSPSKSSNHPNPFVELLRDQPIMSTFLQNSISELTSFEEEEEVTTQKAARNQERLKEVCANRIVFNSSLIPDNLVLLKLLNKVTSLDIEEFDLDILDVDFIISPTVGVMIVNNKLCNQVKENGRSVLEERILLNKTRYKNLYVFIETSGLSKVEALFGFQVCMSLIEVRTCLVNDDHDVCQRINCLSLSFGTLMDLEMINCPDVLLLSQCGLNTMLAIHIIQRCNLDEFIMMDHKERTLKFCDCISTSQLDRLDALFNTEWSFLT